MLAATVLHTFCAHADGSVTDIAPLSAHARRLLPQLEISSSIFTERSAERLREWRARECSPGARVFRNGHAVEPQLPVTPRRRPLNPPVHPTLLELTVYPDALETTPQPPQTGFAVRFPFCAFHVP